MINYFTLLGLEQKYFINKDDLEKKYFALQMQFHPDRYIGKSESEKISTIKKSADINEAYAILSDDVERANHLLALENIFVNKEKDNSFKPSHALLVEQMEFREKASDVESGNENKAELLSHFQAEFEVCKKDFNEYYDNKNLAESAQSAMRLKYLDKLIKEII